MRRSALVSTTGEPGDPSQRPAWLAFRRGAKRRCPRCGKGNIFVKFLKVNDHCSDCNLDLASYRSDDAPPYFTILLVGHIVIPGMLLLERAAHPPEWVHTALWIPLALGLVFLFLPRIKGAVIGWQWATATKG